MFPLPQLNEFGKTILVGNINLVKAPNDCEFVFFNPWGFSKLGIENALRAKLLDCNFQPNQAIYVCIHNLFFGRRAEIVVSTLRELFPLSQISKISEEELKLLLNNPSV